MSKNCASLKNVLLVRRTLVSTEVRFQNRNSTIPQGLTNSVFNLLIEEGPKQSADTPGQDLWWDMIHGPAKVIRVGKLENWGWTYCTVFKHGEIGDVAQTLNHSNYCGVCNYCQGQRHPPCINLCLSSGITSAKDRKAILSYAVNIISHTIQFAHNITYAHI